MMVIVIQIFNLGVSVTMNSQFGSISSILRLRCFDLLEEKIYILGMEWQTGFGVCAFEQIVDGVSFFNFTL
jgi:hypothetical protein